MTGHADPAPAVEVPEAVTKLFPLLTESGAPFTNEELAQIRAALGGLHKGQREEIRNANATAIALNDARRTLIVSGPGTGKSTLFIARLRHWLSAHSEHKVSVSTFVRKLVADLRQDLTKDSTLSDDDKKRVEIQTLHRAARSIVETNNGTKDLPLRPHCRIISREWEDLLWRDTLDLHPGHEAKDFPWPKMRSSLHDAEPLAEDPWAALRKSHLRLQRLFNALSFPDLILTATQALHERPELAADTLFIIDEFQDFNLADRGLIEALTNEAPGLLLAGDDDQVLYDGLRGAHASIIRDYYHNPGFAKAMLPFCSRCSQHICEVAESFLLADRPPEAISKLFLPLEDIADPKVVIVAATSPKAGVGYIERFIDEHKAQLGERAKAIAERKEKDPYLLLLTPARNMAFLKPGGALLRLRELLAPYSVTEAELCDDYWKLHDYYYLAKEPSQNFLMRKVFIHEGVAPDTSRMLIRRALDEESDFVGLGDDVTAACLDQAAKVRQIIESGGSGAELTAQLVKVINISTPDELARSLDQAPLAKADADDARPEFDQTALAAAQIVTVVGAKGLSADHVIVLGCDQLNLKWTTRNAFFVALTRARKSLTLMACMGGGGANSLHQFLRGLPDPHVTALYVKEGQQIECQSIRDLQGRLGKMAYAKKMAKLSHKT